MPKIVTFSIPAIEFSNSEFLMKALAKESGLMVSDISNFNILKQSIDARQRAIKFNLSVEVFSSDELYSKYIPLPKPMEMVHNKAQVVVVGAGPAGLFAALKLIELGLCPVIIERGKDIRERRRDLAKLNKEHIVNSDSNYCFGEGGAGTYSDGKLYTRSNKRGDVNEILDTLVLHGADPNILVNAHPHIGTNKLPNIIASIRESIINYGGKVLFNSKLTDILIKESKVIGVVINNSDVINCQSVILATGHSARDIYKLLHAKNIELEAKAFAIGVRAEHKQSLINCSQYHLPSNVSLPTYLPPAAYSLVKQVNGRGVYSFCMCPGGIIAPCSTEQGLVVTNGWSPSKRDNLFANSGIVVETQLADIPHQDKYGVLAGMYYQESIEALACNLAGGTQTAPAQKLVDFCNNKVSNGSIQTSYIPGVKSINLSEVLPSAISDRLKVALKEFDKNIHGFF